MRCMISAGPPAKRPPHSALAAGRRLWGGALMEGGSSRDIRPRNGAMMRSTSRGASGRPSSVVLAGGWTLADFVRIPRRPKATRRRRSASLPRSCRRGQRRRCIYRRDGPNRDPRRFPRPAWCWLICGRHGASPASRKCRRWPGFRRRCPAMVSKSCASPRTARRGRRRPVLAKLGMTIRSDPISTPRTRRPRLHVWRAADQHPHRPRRQRARPSRRRRDLGRGRGPRRCCAGTSSAARRGRTRRSRRRRIRA